MCSLPIQVEKRLAVLQCIHLGPADERQPRKYLCFILGTLSKYYLVGVPRHSPHHAVLEPHTQSFFNDQTREILSVLELQLLFAERSVVDEAAELSQATSCDHSGSRVALI